MRQPDQFNKMLDYSHIAAAVFKALFALVGFLTFGADTDQEITNNLPTAGFKALVNLVLVCKALLSYPLPFFAAMELIDNVSLLLMYVKKRHKRCALDGRRRVERKKENISI